METSSPPSVRCIVFSLGEGVESNPHQIDCIGRALSDIESLPAFVRDAVRGIINAGEPTYQIVRNPDGSSCMGVMLEVTSPVISQKQEGTPADEGTRFARHQGGGGWQNSHS